MRSSLVLLASGAALSLASPIGKLLDERALKVDVVWDTVTVTVTAGQEPSSGAVFMESENKAPKPAPEPTTTTTTTSVPPPAPKTKKPKPAPEPTTTSEAPPPPPETTSTSETPVVVTIQPSTTSSTAEPSATSGGDDSGSDGGDTSGSLDKYAQTMVDQHNAHRRNHSASDLKWNSELAEWAMNTAKSCVFEHDMDQGSGGYGQNIAMSASSGDISTEIVHYGAAAVSDMWYNEEACYQSSYGKDNPETAYNADGSVCDTGHFSQLVWLDTQEVGCASVNCPSMTNGMDSIYTACNYKNPGNYGGEYATNVKRPLGYAAETV